MNKKILLICSFLMFISTFGAKAAGTYAITAPNVVGGKGQVVNLPVRLYNTLPLRDFNLHLRLPEGITIQQDSNGKNLLELNTELAPDHTIASNLNNDFYSIVISTQELTTITSDNEVLFTIPLVLNTELGEYEYTFDYVTASQYLDGVVSTIFMSNFTGKITVESAVELEDCQFYSPHLITETGSAENILGVCLNNSQAVKAFNFDIEFPAGIEPIYNEDNDDYVEYGDRIPSRYNVFGEIVDGLLNVDGATSRSSSIAAGDGVVVTIALDINLPEGRYPIVYKNQTLTLSDGTEVDSPDFTAYVIVDKPTEMVNIITYNDKLSTASDPRNYAAKDAQGNWVANEIYITDANPIEIEHALTAATINYARNFSYDVWQALYVPYNMSYEEWSEVGQVAQLTGVKVDDEGDAVLEWQVIKSGELTANHPYIIKPISTGKCVFTGTDRELQATADVDVVSYTDTNNNTYTLAGVYQYKYDMYTSGSYGLATDGNFKHVKSNEVMLKPMRIYLTVNAASAQSLNKIKIRIVDDATGIEDIMVTTDQDGTYYDLMGRKVDNPVHGLYIQRGNKVIIK